VHLRLTRLVPFIKLARWLARSYDPFIYFPSVFEVGLESGIRSDHHDDEGDVPVSEYDVYSLCRCIFADNFLTQDDRGPAQGTRYCVQDDRSRCSRLPKGQAKVHTRSWEARESHSGGMYRLSFFFVQAENPLIFSWQMGSALSAARSDDISSLRTDGLTYVALDLPDKVLNPPILPKSPKTATRGFNHAVLGRLLCPIKYISDFDNPEKR
jgi:hypothetical protein